MPERVRRVITGEPVPGQSAFTHVEEVAPIVSNAARIYPVWGYDTVPVPPHYSAEPFVPQSTFPAPGGARVEVVAFPGPASSPQAAAAVAPSGTPSHTDLLNAVPAGLTRQQSPGGATNMHRTDTIDIGFVLSGRIAITCTNGDREVLECGDVYVQNAAMHAWEGLATDTENVMAFVLLPSAPRQQTPSTGRDDMIADQERAP